MSHLESIDGLPMFVELLCFPFLGSTVPHQAVSQNCGQTNVGFHEFHVLFLPHCMG